jgi:hypothetical protein
MKYIYAIIVLPVAHWVCEEETKLSSHQKCLNETFSTNRT